MNIYNEFRKTAINRYSKTALVMMNDEGETKEYTFGQTLQQADVFCSRLKAMGIVAGDRVCIASEGRPEWNIAFLACAKLNATAVLLDYSLPAAELVALVKKSQPVCVVASQKAAKKLTSVKNIPVLDIQNQLDRLDGSGENILRQGEVGDPDIAVIIFSSGTTRTASGIMHTHDSQINSCKMVCQCNGITDNERYLGILPNSHIYGLFAQVLAPLLTGGTVCFIESLSAKGLSAGFQNFKPTVFPGVPKVYELLKTQIMQQINASKVSSALFKKMFPVALHQLMNVINQVMKQAKTKKQFCFLMKQQGYDVRWEDNRKYITYTCPNGRRCRDNKLHGERYRKENMEYEFETRRIAADVRQGIVSSGGHSANSGGARFQLESADRIEQADVAGAAGNTHQTLGAGDESGYRTVAENSTLRAEGYHSDLSGTAESSRRTVGNSDGSTGESNSGPVFTGWEVERGIWLEAERARRIQAQAKIKSSQVDSDLAVGIDSIVGGVATMASIIEDEPADDTEYARENVDRKALAEERERKEALGIHMG